MSISFKGNSPDFRHWVFDINGLTFMANNASTQNPLRIRFENGRFFDTKSYGQIVPGGVLVKNTGFDMMSGTYEGPQGPYAAVGLVDWKWAGKEYLSRWTLSPGRVIAYGVPEEGQPDEYDFVLDIVPPYVTRQELEQRRAEAEALKQREAEALRRQQEAEALRRQQEAEALRRQQEAEALRRQQEAEQKAAEAKARQDQADRDAADARRRQDQAAEDEARRKKAEADRLAAEAAKDKKEADKAVESTKPAGSKTEIGTLLVRLGILYALFG